MTENTTTAAPAATQPEALRLAEILDNFYTGIGRIDATAAAAELRRLHALTAAPAAQEVEPAGYRISDPNEPDIGSWLSETPARTKYGLLSEPLYAHPPRPQADAGAPMTHAEAAAAIGITSAIHRIESGDAQGALEPLREAARVLSDAAPQAPAAATAAALEQAWRAGWAACRDAEYVGEEAEDWAWGASATNGLAIDIEQSAPAAAVAPAEAAHKAAVDHAHEILGRLLYLRDGDYFVNVNRAGAEAMHVSTVSTIVHAALIGAAAPTQEADGWMPIDTAPDGERVLLGPRHAPVVGMVHRPAFWEEEQEPTATVVHYNGNVLVAGYRCSEWHRLPGSAPAQEAEDAARYRILRRGQHWSVVNGVGDTLRADDLDADIDAARARQEGGGA